MAGRTNMGASGAFKPALWVLGDRNAFFGFGSNMLMPALCTAEIRAASFSQDAPSAAARDRHG